MFTPLTHENRWLRLHCHISYLDKTINMLTKPVIFYSSFCEHSNHLLTTLVKKNLREKFILVNVDKYAQKLPQCVDRVPLLMTPEKKTFSDDVLFEFVESLVDTNSVCDYDGGASMGECFSYIDNDGGSGVMGGGVGACFSSVQDESRIYTPTDDEFNTGRGDVTIDKIKMEREKEIQSVKPSRPINAR
jgi:hypothetical protein